MFWEFRSAASGGEDELRGWSRFHQATGKWPWWSILTTLVGLPLCFCACVYGFIQSLKTGRLLIIYPSLFGSVVGPAAGWFVVRRLANAADVSRAQQHRASAKPLRRYIE